MRWEAAAPMVSRTVCEPMQEGERPDCPHVLTHEGAPSIMSTRRTALKLVAASAASAASFHLPGAPAPVTAAPVAPQSATRSLPDADRLFGPESPLYESNEYAAYQQARAALLSY